MPRRVEAPVNRGVHSAAREEGNARLILAEMRMERFHLVVFFDYTDELFHFQKSEHRREVDHVTRDNERALLDQFLYAMDNITKKRLKERSFEKKTAINQDWVPGKLDVPIRRFDPSKVKPRSIFDRYKPFNPNED